MKLRILSPTLIEQVDSIAIIAAGPSLIKVQQNVIDWCIEYNAMIIGAHYRYFVKPSYTVFTTPAKFRKGQGKIPGIYIVGPRIKIKDIKKKYYSRILRMKYTRKKLLEWSEPYFVTPSGKVPEGGCGFEAALIGTMCRPKNMLMAGFDGFQMVKGKLVVRHANKSMVRVKAKRSIEIVNRKNPAHDMKLERQRKQMLYKMFEFFIQLNIRPYIFEKDKFRQIDKNRLKDMGVTIL